MITGSDDHLFYVLCLGTSNDVAGHIVEVNLLDKTTREIIRFNEDRYNRIASRSNTLYFLTLTFQNWVTSPSLAWIYNGQAIYGPVF